MIMEVGKKGGARVGEIASASGEQSQGVSEINKAMNQLDEVTQQNAAASQSSSREADSLKTEAETLQQLINELEMIIRGVGAQTATAAVQTPPPSSGKVVSLATRKKAKVEKNVVSAPTKMAAGAESIPLANDDRFEDV